MEKKSRELLAPHVEEELMDYILHTPVKIGEKLPNEFELAELFGVGRSTVRETVKSLVSKGVLEVRRGSGTYVIGTNRLEDDPLGLSGFTDKYELALDLCNVRLMLEPEIAMLASENATDEEKAEARQRAIRQYQDEELRKMQNRNKAKANQKTNAQQVELSLF